jgi:hypothetical protein
MLTVVQACNQSLSCSASDTAKGDGFEAIYQARDTLVTSVARIVEVSGASGRSPC